MIRTILVILLSLCFLGCSHAPDKQGTPSQDQWPTTVKATVADILAALPASDKEIVRNTKKDDLILFHHGWGTGIRNHYGLWHGNTALIQDACTKPCEPDDASMLIIQAVWEALQLEG